MYRHLLVTLDGTPRAESVIPHSIDVARSMAAEMTLLRIVDAAGADWSERGALGKSALEAASRTALTEQAQDYLDRVAEQVRRSGVNVNTLVRQGPPARQIVNTAKDIDAEHHRHRHALPAGHQPPHVRQRRRGSAALLQHPGAAGAGVLAGRSISLSASRPTRCSADVLTTETLTD